MEVREYGGTGERGEDSMRHREDIRPSFPPSLRTLDVKLF